MMKGSPNFSSPVGLPLDGLIGFPLTKGSALSGPHSWNFVSSSGFQPTVATTSKTRFSSPILVNP